jgi:hypothetical protein
MLAPVTDDAAPPAPPDAPEKRARASLPVAPPRSEKLGAPTIMDRELAAQLGVHYVHLAAFAIDTDRVRARFEEVLVEEDQLPFGWEVFLTAQYLRATFDPAHEGHRMVVEDAVQAVMDRPARSEAALGAQLPFALYDLVRRGLWPEDALSVFGAWRKKPDATLDELAPLWDDAVVAAGEFAHACLQCDLEPPAAPPVQEAWGRFHLAARAAGDDASDEDADDENPTLDAAEDSILDDEEEDSEEGILDDEEDV